MTSEATNALAAIEQQHDIVIETERLVMRPVIPADIYALHRIRRNPAVMTYMSTGVETEEDPFKSQSLTRMHMMTKPGFLSFAIEEKPFPSQNSLRSRPVIGFAGMHRIPEVFYIYDSSAWGKGYATEALRAYQLAYWENRPVGVPGMTEDERDVLLAYVFDGNTSSEKVATKSGFRLLVRGMLKGQTQAVFEVIRPGKSNPQALERKITHLFNG